MIKELARHNTLKDASAAADIPYETARRMMRDSDVQAALAEMRQEAAKEAVLEAANLARLAQEMADKMLANEEALRAQARNRAAMLALNATIERLMNTQGLSRDAAVRKLQDEEELDRAIARAVEREQERKAAALEAEAVRIGAQPWLASGERKETKAAPFAISQTPAPALPLLGTGRFEGLAAAFGNRDSYDDVIERGAFTKTLNEAKARGKSFLWPLLYQHDPHKVIGGVASAIEQPDGLYVTCALDLNTKDGAEAFSLIKGGYLDGLSIGFIAVKEGYAGGVRHLKELRLLEVSVVTFPANTTATITNTSY